MQRNPQLDFFRGFFILIITIDHFFSENNIIRKITEESLGWVSAAEGFVFLSGLTAGLVYTRKLIEAGPAYISRAASKRAWVIYKYHIILFLLTIAILFSHYYMKEFWFERYSIIFQKPLIALMLGGLFLYQPIYLDILPMYAVFMLLVPIVIKSFQKGYSWYILILSLILYLVGTADINLPFFTNLPLGQYFDLGTFDLFCWQLLFVYGLFIGHLMYHGQLDVITKNYGLFYVALLICVSLFFLKLFFADIDSNTIDLWLGKYAWLEKYSLVDKGNLRPLRALNFALLVFVVAFIAAKNKHWFTFKPICYLGLHSLKVFSLHIILIILFNPLKVYTNKFYAVPVGDELYFYPLATLMLLFIIIPALYMAPIIIKQRSYGLKTKANS